MLYRCRLSDTYVTCVCQTAGRSQNNSFMPYPVSVFYYGFSVYNRIFCRDHCSRIRFRYHKLYRNYVLCNAKHRVPTVTWRNIDTVLCIPDWIQSDWLHHRMLYSARMCQSWPALYKTPHSWCNSCVFHCYHGYAGHYLSGNASSLW